MVRQLSERGMTTIPKDSLRKVAEDKFTDSEWDKLERLAKKKGKTYTTAKAAKEHIKRLR